MTRKILILFAHPVIRRSRIQKALITAARGLDDVTVHDLYETYPDFAIDIEHEQTLLAAHDVLVLQHPLYWYSSPAIMKEWMDLVLEHGWAYGRHGSALKGKLWMQAISTGGRDRAYGAGGLNRYSIDEVLRPFEATAHLCGMTWQKPFVVHAAHYADTPEIERAAGAYRDQLAALRGLPAPTGAA